MKNQLNYSNFIKAIVFLLFTSQLLANTIPYVYSIVDTDTDLIELTTSEDSESEEEDNKKEKEDKIRESFMASNDDAMKSHLYILHSKEHFYLHYPEIIKPPPKSLFILS